MKKELGLMSIIILIDQITKIYIYNTMVLGESIDVIENVFSIRFHLNNGAAWGIFAGNMLFLILITVAVIIGILYYMYKHPVQDKFTRYGLILYVAGAIGNLIDRVRMGEVIDFFDVVIPVVGYDFPIFNIADMSLVCGFILIFIAVLKEKNNGK